MSMPPKKARTLTLPSQAPPKKPVCLLDLPLETLVYIITFTSPIDIMSLRKVCHGFALWARAERHLVLSGFTLGHKGALGMELSACFSTTRVSYSPMQRNTRKDTTRPRVHCSHPSPHFPSTSPHCYFSTTSNIHSYTMRRTYACSRGRRRSKRDNWL